MKKFWTWKNQAAMEPAVRTLHLNGTIAEDSWFDDEVIRGLCGLAYPVRLVITLGYAREDDALRAKKRKPMDELTSFVG